MKKLLIFLFLFINSYLFSAEMVRQNSAITFSDLKKEFLRLRNNFDANVEYHNFHANNYLKSIEEILTIMKFAVLYLSEKNGNIEFDKYLTKITALEKEHVDIQALKLYRYLYELGKKINSSNPVNHIMKALGEGLTAYKCHLNKIKQKEIQERHEADVQRQQAEKAELNFEQILSSQIPSKL